MFVANQTNPISITASKLCNRFKISIGLMVKSLSGFLPLWQLTEGALIHHPKEYSVSAFYIFTYLPIGALICEALEILPGLCGLICTEMHFSTEGPYISLYVWGTEMVTHSKTMLTTII
jgi:hypothetical protein